ncbi:PTS lactose transporter subunit IIBC [Granulicatella sp. zg-ZJ]|uniref:lactose-specific PTS transporter subunit EIIC n=1 Tax=Granulicatella sp. zg-ZJ TaxID=2678504 RepID=UPI0013D67CFB|nr:lactose-specific PTS transporter subunit EIIC [Granulicatella sp. zg-ZJ]NEW63233.1 PTS lactose transporter subunit IIBC [Granulicatella sp. zg-ZJ]
MNGLISKIEATKPFFEKISRNKYLRAIQEGFIAAMPVVLFSSMFLLVAFVPNVFGFFWSKDIEALIMKPYHYSMGIIAVLVSATTAKSLTDSFNRQLEKTNQINHISTMLAAIVGFLLLSCDLVDNAFSKGYLGTTGLIAAFISAFITVNIYYLCTKNNITIRMLEEVPPNIAQTFKNVIPFSLTVFVLFGIDILIRSLLGKHFAQAMIEVLQPLFSAADGYVGIAIIYGAMALFWFVGIHGPSVVEPAVAALMYINVDANLKLFQSGAHATNIVTPGLQMFVATMGGTGATFVVPFMFMWLGKSKQNKAVGRSSFIPTAFGVNEPILFGAPLVLNPVFFIPFVLAPIVNVFLFKEFVDVLGMNGSMHTLPWTTPAPIGLILTTGLDKFAFVLAPLLIVLDTLIYYPFFKVYDKQILEKELTEKQHLKGNQQDAQTEIDMTVLINETRVLVLCAGGGTSGLLANALNKAAKEYQQPISAAADSYGAHHDILSNFDLVVLAPQVASNYEDIKKETDALHIKLVKTKGAEYIGLTRDPKGSLDFVLKQFQD